MNEIMLCPYEALAAPTSGSSHSIDVDHMNYPFRDNSCWWFGKDDQCIFVKRDTAKHCMIHNKILLS